MSLLLHSMLVHNNIPSTCIAAPAAAAWPSGAAAASTTTRKQQQKQQQRQRRLLRPLQLLLLLLLASAASAQPVSKPGLITDADMGVHMYDSILQHAPNPVDVRMWMRFLCQQPVDASSSSSAGSSAGSSGITTEASSSSSSSGQAVAVKGFAMTSLLTNESLPWAPSRQHYLPVYSTYKLLNVSIIDRSTNSKTYLSWIGPPNYGGLWRLKGQLQGPGPFQLSLEGSSTVHDLPLPMCQQQQPQQLQLQPEQQPRWPGGPSGSLGGGIWNVLTTTSNTTISPKTLAFLLMHHNNYHRSMGLSGTILRSNTHESRALMQLPDIQKAVSQQQLIIWPWEYEHVGNYSTHFWQRAKNQLTLLGMYGRDARLAYFDLDEYLVLPDGGSVTTSQCFGQPLLHKGTEGKLGSWTFIRFQAKTCPDSNSDLPCWENGNSVNDDAASIKLLHDLCPMSTGHGKQIMVTDMVDIPSVHFSFSEAFEGNHLVNMSCGYLLHLYSLLEDRRVGVTNTLRKIPALSWNLDPAHGRRRVKWPAGLAPVTYETCVADSGARPLAIAKYNKAHHRARLSAAAAAVPLPVGHAQKHPHPHAPAKKARHKDKGSSG